VTYNMSDFIRSHHVPRVWNVTFLSYSFLCCVLRKWNITHLY